MSRLMTVLGIVLLAVGFALAIVGLVNPGQVQVYGATLDTAAILFVGGVLAIGQGGLLALLEGGKPVRAALPAAEAAPAHDSADDQADDAASTVAEEPAEPEQPAPSRIRFTGFGKKLGATIVTGAAASSAAASTASSSVQDTIAALEQAKADIKSAVGGVDATVSGAAADEPIADDGAEEYYEDEAPAAGGDAELFVIEEREVRGHPARILSDNTVEAETAEGWMRFENLEHLNEYLDATEGA